MIHQDSPAHSGLARRDFIKLGSTAAIASLGLGAKAGADTTSAGKPSKRPNIVYVFSDEHRWQSLPFTEMPEVVAPNMTKLAQQGMRFDNCCSTSPVCTPHRGILLTGQWPHQSNCISNDTFINGDAIGKTSPTVAHMFKEAGYKTGYVGKWHLRNETCAHAGFDTFKHWLYGDEHWETKVRDIPSGEDFKIIEGYNAIGMTDQAIEFVNENAGGDQPFMLMLSLNPPHWRWDDSPEEFYALYPEDKITFRPNVTVEGQKSGKMLEYYRHYHGHISAVDRELGRMMQALEDAGIADDTVLIYTSDHGSSFGSNGVQNKGNPFDESVRVPFIVRWPDKIAAGAVSERNLGTIDVVPTLCGLGGFKAPDHCGGQDFSPVFLGKAGPDPETQFLIINNFNRNYYHSQLIPGERSALSPFRAVRGKRYSYAVDPFGVWFLYDNRKDPFQMNNLANDPAYANIRNQMAAELDAWIAKAEIPYISEEWRAMPLPERIQAEAEYFSLVESFPQWERYKAAALAPYIAQANAQQAAKLRTFGDELYDLKFFGLYKSLDNELNQRKRGTNLPKEELQARLDALETDYNARLATGAGKILAA